MRKSIFFGGTFLISDIVFGQVGINTEKPKATLDVVASPNDFTKTDGIIAPRLTGQQLKSKDLQYSNPDQDGPLVYITTPLAQANTSVKTANVVQRGYYYFDGVLWQKLLTSFDTVPLDDTNGKWIRNTTLEAIHLKKKSTGVDRDAGTEIVSMDNGRFGLGINNPLNIFHVNSPKNTNLNQFFARFTSPDMEQGNSIFLRLGKNDITKNSANLSYKYNGNSSNDSYLGLGFAEIEISFVLTAGGNVGLGFQSSLPLERLDVYSGNIRIRDINSNAGSSTVDKVVVANPQGVLKTVDRSSFFNINTKIYTDNGILGSNSNVNQNRNPISFTNANINNSFSIDGVTFSVDGFTDMIGIGTATPSQKLDVDGNIRLRELYIDNSTLPVANTRYVLADSNGVLKSLARRDLIARGENVLIATKIPTDPGPSFQNGDIMCFCT